MVRIIKNRRYLYYILFWAAVIVALFWKCKFGYATLDEAFYPTIGYRFLQGDKILYEEWSNTQLCGVLMMPFLKLWLLINGDMTGVYLFIRYAYTVLKIAISLLVYFRLRKYGETAAFFTASFFLIFAAYGMMVLSYNTFAFGGMVVALVTFLNEDTSFKSNISRIISGIALSVAVLGIPYMAIIYIIFAISVIIIAIMNKKGISITNRTIESCYSINSFIFVSIGVAISIVLYMSYVFSNTSLEQIIQTIPHILLGDPAHKAKSLYGLSLAYFVRILIGNNHNYLLFAVYSLIAIMVIAYFLDKKREFRKDRYLFLSVILTFALLMIYILTDSYINNVAFVPVICALMFSVIINDSLLWALFFTLCVPGIIVTYAEYLASNTGFSGIAASSCVPAVGSIMVIGVVAKKLLEERKRERYLIEALLCTIICCCMFYRLTYVFWEDGGMASLNEKLTFGVCSGLKVTPETAEKYNAIYEDTCDIRKLPTNINVLYVGDKILWMTGSQRCGSYSPLCYSISDHTDILWDYYNEHPDKLPEVIYVQKGYDKSFVEKVADELEFSVLEKNAGYCIYSEKVKEYIGR